MYTPTPSLTPNIYFMYLGWTSQSPLLRKHSYSAGLILLSSQQQRLPCQSWTFLSCIVTVSMKQQRIQFHKAYIELSLKQSPFEKWVYQNKFPHKMVLCILLIILASIKSYFYSTILSRQPEIFVRGLNYQVLNHTDTGVYYGSPDMINLPIKLLFTTESLQTNMFQTFQFFRNLDSNSFGFVDQSDINTKARSLLLNYRNGSSISYNFTVEQGISLPFNMSDMQELKRSVNSVNSLRLVFQGVQQTQSYIDYAITKDYLFEFDYQFYHLAAVRLQVNSDFIYSIDRVQPGSSAQNLAKAPVKLLMAYNVWVIETFLTLIGVLYFYLHMRSFRNKLLIYDKVKDKQKIPRPKLPWLQLLTGILTVVVSACSVVFQYQSNLNISAGIVAGLAWLNLPNYMGHVKNLYFIILLLQKSPPFLLRWLVSSLPLFLGMSLMGTVMFARLTWLFESWWTSTLSLFYICYYNMHYEEMIVTESRIFNYTFFFVFTVIFTYCVYGSLLVAMFCSFVWDQKQESIQLEILSNLKITCSSCQTKFAYAGNNYDQQMLQREFGISALYLASGSHRVQNYKSLLEMNNSQCQSLRERVQQLREQLKFLICQTNRGIVQQGSREVGKSLQSLREASKELLKRVRRMGKNQKRKLQ